MLKKILGVGAGCVVIVAVYLGVMKVVSLMQQEPTSRISGHTNYFHPQKKPDLTPEYMPVTGRIIYKDYATERGDGKPSADPVYTVLLAVDSGSTFAQTNFAIAKPFFSPTDNAYFVSLGCITSKNTGEMVSYPIVYAMTEEGQKGFVQKDTVKTSIGTTLLSGSTVTLLMTKPITSFVLDRDLPDRGRAGDCTADAYIKFP